MAVKHPPYDGASDGDAREPYVHIALAVIKGVGGGLLGSSALLADALRSISDCCRSKAAGRPPRRLPPTDYAATEICRTRLRLAAVDRYITAAGGVAMGYWRFRRLIDPVPSYPRLAAAFVLPVCLALRLTLMRGAIPRVEWAASLAAAVGAGGAWAGGESGIDWLTLLDPGRIPAGQLLIVCQGYLLIRGNGWRHSDALPDTSRVASDLMELIQRVDGVLTVETVQPVLRGGRMSADIVISVNPRISVLQGSDIGRRVRQLVMRRFMHMNDIRISVEPYHPSYPYKSNHDPNQEQCLHCCNSSGAIAESGQGGTLPQGCGSVSLFHERTTAAV